MTADRDYYSGAFLDWFPGNIQHFSIACVLLCPPAAQQQYNETTAGGGAAISTDAASAPLMWLNVNKELNGAWVQMLNAADTPSLIETK